MTITPREKVRAVFKSAMANAPTSVEWAGAVDWAVEETARQLGLTPEAVEEALQEPEHA